MDPDSTHDADLKSWVVSANGHPDFPIQNLPFGIFSPPPVSPARGSPSATSSSTSPRLRGSARSTRRRSGSWTRRRAAPSTRRSRSVPALAGRCAGGCPRCCATARRSAARSSPLCMMQPNARCTCRPRIGDYTDFYVGIHHATNIGKLFRPDSPLLPNYKWVPIGYHGRASSVRVSGTAVRRPLGQTKAPDAAEPTFGPCRRLDYELELGIWMGPGNELGPADRDRRRSRPHCGLLPPQRLVGARHTGLGVPAARPLPGEELRLDGLTVGDHPGGAGAVPRRATRPARRVIRRRCPTSSTTRTSAEARSRSTWRC